jgi:hypothetical protein
MRKAAYYQANVEEIKAKDKLYRDAHKTEISERGKAYYENNAEFIKARAAEYRANNKEIVNARRKISHQCTCGGHYTLPRKADHERTTKHHSQGVGTETQREVR